jgi:antitoxin component of MazEF toxin-antitoxin module
MKVAKWGNALVGLKDGDQVDIRVSGERAFVVARAPRPTEPPAASRVPPR